MSALSSIVPFLSRLFFKCQNTHDFVAIKSNKQLSIRVTGDKLSEIGEALQPAAGETILNLDGDYLLPGFVDDL